MSSLITRIVTNAGSPICTPDGTPIAGVNIIFTLVTPLNVLTSAFDAITGARVGGCGIIYTRTAICVGG